MPYFNLSKITPAAPNDPNVNEVTQINNNWDEIENKFGQQSAGTPPGAETGQEWLSGGRFKVWTGTAVRDPDNIDGAWSAWTALPLSANVVTRPNYTPRYRSNSMLRRVELAGDLLKDAAGSAWPVGVAHLVTTGTSGIPSTLQPIGGLTYQMTACSIPTGSGGSGWHQIDVATGFVRIQTRMLGGGGGGNFIPLDGIEWWY